MRPRAGPLRLNHAGERSRPSKFIPPVCTVGRRTRDPIGVAPALGTERRQNGAEMAFHSGGNRALAVPQSPQAMPTTRVTKDAIRLVVGGSPRTLAIAMPVRAQTYGHTRRRRSCVRSARHNHVGHGSVLTPIRDDAARQFIGRACPKGQWRIPEGGSSLRGHAFNDDFSPLPMNRVPAVIARVCGTFLARTDAIDPALPAH
jgi:hypothetical protein